MPAAPASAPASVYPRARIIAALNAERAEHGLPPVTERREWSKKCALHNAYGVRNGTLGHDEDPARPGYTEGGRWAGANSILAAGTSWANGNVFATAPIHLIQLMSPLLKETGVDERDGYVCMTTWPGYDHDRYASPRVFGYPGDGAVDVPAAEEARERPFVPGDFVGLPAGTVTGFHIMAWGVGMDRSSTRLRAAELRGPNGKLVRIKRLDRASDEIGPYLGRGAAILIPVRPLAERRVYTVSVGFVDDSGRKVARTWSFTTGGTAAAAPPPPVRGRVRSGTLTLTAAEAGPVTLRLRDTSRFRWVGKSVEVELAAGATRLSVGSLFGDLKPGGYLIQLDLGDGAGGLVRFDVR